MVKTLLSLGVGTTCQSKLCLKLKVTLSLQGDASLLSKRPISIVLNMCPVNAPVYIY